VPYFTFKEKQIYYQIREVSNQNALIFIHGSGENSNAWENQLNLNIDYNLIALDLPSHAESDKFEDLTLNLYVDVIRQLILTLKIEKVILCGHSLGGAIAQAYYFRYPEDTNGLILVGTGAKLRVSPFILEVLQKDIQEYVDSIPMGAFYRRTDKKIIEELIEEVKKTEGTVIYTDFSICDKFDTIDKTSSINVPCLIIVGKADKLTPVKYSQFFHEKIKDSELLVINRAGHMVMVEQPDEFNKAVEEYIKKL